MKHYLNVCDINGASVAPVDVITFGSPCQDMSVAGKRAGLKHGEQGDDETTRSGLFYEAVRIIKEMRKATHGEYPKYAVWENVPGAFSSNKGWDFHAVLEALCSVCDSTVSIPAPYDKRSTDKLVWNGAGEIVGDGYSLCWRTLDAQYWGVPQRRKRIYLVADFNTQRAGEILFKPSGLRGNLPQSNEPRQGAAADVVGGADGSFGDECVAGFDGYNAALTGNHAATLGVNCGLSSGRNGLILKEHAGCEGGGKGALWSDKAFTLATSQDMSAVFLNDQGGQRMDVNSEVGATLRAEAHHPPIAVYAFDSLASNSMKSANPISGCRETEVEKCLDASFPSPAKNQEEEETSPTLRAGVTPATVIALQGNGIDRADTAGCNGCGWREDVMYTLNTIDRPAVCFDRATFNQGMNAQYDFEVSESGIVSTVVARGPSGVCYGIGNGQADNTKLWHEQVGTLNCMHDQQAICVETYHAVALEGQTSTLKVRDWKDHQCVAIENHPTDSRIKLSDDGMIETLTSRMGTGGGNVPMALIDAHPPRKYIIRRLMPVECARLQGFPDWWADVAMYNPADAEFWESVRKTQAEINGTKYKPVKNIKAWHDKLHTDGAEYKMWGNGIALPCAEYVIHGLAEQGVKTLASLFDGSGGFPLAGVMNGIRPLWSSEIEPYPIAVTVSRFGREE